MPRRQSIRTIILLPYLIGLPALAADIYRCDTERGPVFSQTLCGTSATTIEIDRRTLTPPTNDPGHQRMLEDHARFRQQVEHDRQIATLQVEIRKLEAERDTKLAAIQQKRQRAANNLAGATWESALATDAKTVQEEYGPRIQVLRDELKDLQASAP